MYSFGFFLNGPGIAGTFSGGASNIALVSSSTTPISINTSGYFAEFQSITGNVTPVENYECQIDNGSFQNSNVFTNMSSGTHTVVVKNKCGSIGSDTVTIVDYPRFFTPNGEGCHDQWNISVLSGQAKAKIYIFDRFGKLLKQIRPSSSGWDGTFNRKDLLATDYWFVVNYNEKNIEKEFKSHFALKR